MERLAHRANFLLGLAVEVVARLFLDSFEDRQAAEGGFEADGLAVDFRFGLAVHGDADAFERLLGEGHHPVVVLILHVEFHAGELGVVVAVHALVAEVLSDFVHALETAHDEAFQVEFRRDAQIQVHAERVVVRDEGACAGAAGYRLQDRRFHLRIARFVERGAERLNHRGALEERLLHVGVHDEVHVALAVAQFGVVEGIVRHAVLFLHHGERFEALGQEGDRACGYGNLARLRAEHETFHANEVAEIEQFFEYIII